MAKTKPTRIYFLSYSFYEAPAEEGGCAPVKTTVFADVDGGKVISRLINDFSRWTGDTYDVTTPKVVLSSHEHQWQVNVMPPWSEPLQLYVDFDFYNPESSNFQYSHYDLADVLRTLLLNCSKEELTPEWKATADETMNVVLGYHLL